MHFGDLGLDSSTSHCSWPAPLDGLSCPRQLCSLPKLTVSYTACCGSRLGQEHVCPHVSSMGPPSSLGIGLTQPGAGNFVQQGAAVSNSSCLRSLSSNHPVLATPWSHPPSVLDLSVSHTTPLRASVANVIGRPQAHDSSYHGLTL
jgi:hypothetical protein